MHQLNRTTTKIGLAVAVTLALLAVAAPSSAAPAARTEKVSNPPLSISPQSASGCHDGNVTQTCIDIEGKGLYTRSIEGYVASLNGSKYDFYLSVYGPWGHWFNSAAARGTYLDHHWTIDKNLPAGNYCVFGYVYYGDAWHHDATACKNVHK
ncbi:hypothetical protein GCM10009765_44050 [Fodinicola feengrottensis]|uniref:Secreted protein n=1 Tax=Fodinicola feengrottensis TaxID=435914 RepID=A0ABN2HLZ1_9ACTN